MIGNVLVAVILLFFVSLFVFAFFNVDKDAEHESTRFLEEQEAEITKPADDWVI